MGQSGGGLRTWWRVLYGSDDKLDDNHLMRMAGRFSRRLRAWAKANEIPVVYSSPGERKHDIASEHLATHKVKSGLFLILVSKAPALVWEAQRTGTGKLGPACAQTTMAIRQSLFVSYPGSGLGAPDHQDERTSRPSAHR